MSYKVTTTTSRLVSIAKRLNWAVQYRRWIAWQLQQTPTMHCSVNRTSRSIATLICSITRKRWVKTTTTWVEWRQLAVESSPVHVQFFSSSETRCRISPSAARITLLLYLLRIDDLIEFDWCVWTAYWSRCPPPCLLSVMNDAWDSPDVSYIQYYPWWIVGFVLLCPPLRACALHFIFMLLLHHYLPVSLLRQLFVLMFRFFPCYIWKYFDFDTKTFPAELTVFYQDSVVLKQWVSPSKLN